MTSKRKRPIVAVDGPSGAGKSTVCRAAAKALGYLYIDTGAMYRAAAVGAKRAGLDIEDPVAVEKFCGTLKVGFGKPGSGPDGSTPVLLDNEDVSALIRTPEISMLASRFSAKPALRSRLTEIQRSLGAAGGVVMEGRDIGTVVFPDAEAKFFLSATGGERARRRHVELRQKGENVTYEQVQADMERRDAQDSSREAAPLKQAPGAQAIDSTDLSIDEVVALIVKKARSFEQG